MVRNDHCLAPQRTVWFCYAIFPAIVLKSIGLLFSVSAHLHAAKQTVPGTVWYRRLHSLLPHSLRNSSNGSGFYKAVAKLSHLRPVISQILWMCMIRSFHDSQTARPVDKGPCGCPWEAHYLFLIYSCQRLRWSRGSVLAFGTQVRGFRPGRSRRIFKGEKILSTPSFGGEVKPSVPCRRFAACKRSQNVAWNSTFRQKLLDNSRPQVPPSAAGIFRVVADVGAPGSKSGNF